MLRASGRKGQLMADSNVATEISELGRRWAQAELTGDTTTLDTLLTEDFTGVGPRGFVLTKDQWIQRYSSGGLKNSAFNWADVSVRSYGDAAIAIGVQDQEADYNGQSASGRFRVSQFLVHQNGKWLIAGIHLSGPLPSGPPGPPAGK
jgi:ketosteroid isomerase-like protein